MIHRSGTIQIIVIEAPPAICLERNVPEIIVPQVTSLFGSASTLSPLTGAAVAASSPSGVTWAASTVERWATNWATKSGMTGQHLAIDRRKYCVITTLYGWRMGRDSNPRYPCEHVGFQDRCLKPLGHPSEGAIASFHQRLRPAPSQSGRAVRSCALPAGAGRSLDGRRAPADAGDAVKAREHPRKASLRIGAQAGRSEVHNCPGSRHSQELVMPPWTGTPGLPKPARRARLGRLAGARRRGGGWGGGCRWFARCIRRAAAA